MIRALLVDLGNVLVRFDHRKTIRTIAAHAGVVPDRLETGLFGELEKALDRGDLTAEEFFRAAEGLCDLPRIPDEVWIPAWRDIFEPVPSALAALAAVPRHVVRVLVSNTNALHWDGVLRVAPVETVVDHVFLSFRERVRKPEARFFQAALERAGALPGEAVFADDRPDFVAAARDFGIEGFVVNRPEDLGDELFCRGLGTNNPRSAVVEL